MCWKQISSSFTIKLHKSLPDPPFLRSRPRSRSHDVCLATPTSPLLLLLSLKVSFYYNGEMISFSSKKKNCRFLIPRERKEEKRQTSFTSKQQTFPPKTVSAFSSFARRPGTRGGSAKRCSFPFFLTRRPTNNARPAINWRARIERRR